MEFPLISKLYRIPREQTGASVLLTVAWSGLFRCEGWTIWRLFIERWGSFGFVSALLVCGGFQELVLMLFLTLHQCFRRIDFGKTP